MRKRGKEWADEQVELLRQTYTSDKYNPEEIAQKLGRSVNAIQMKASRLGLHRPILDVEVCPICGREMPR